MRKLKREDLIDNFNGVFNINEIDISNILMFMDDKTLPAKYTRTIKIEDICKKCNKQFRTSINRKNKNSYKLYKDKHILMYCKECRYKSFFEQKYGKGITNPSKLEDIKLKRNKQHMNIMA